MFGGSDLSSRRHQFARPVISQILDLLVMDRQRAINSIDLAIMASGRNNIRTEHVNLSLRQV
jgi:hypothetical protein